jgi:hypothetical protein
VLEDALPGLVHEVEAVEVGVALFEQIDGAQGLQVVLEAAEVLHAGVERLLAGVAEGRVPQIVGEGHGFGEILVEAAPGRSSG